VLTTTPFGTLPDGSAIDLFTIVNDSGFSCRFTNFGAIIVSVVAPDRDRTNGDVVLGYDSLEGYVQQTAYLGAVVGRYANRIDRGRFTLDGRQYQLTTNDGANHLHGGRRGFDKHVWRAATASDDEADLLTFTLTSRDGEEGYPGTLRVRVTYRVPRAANEVQISYEAETDAPTIVNLSQHSYFNLATDRGTSTIVDHRLTIAANAFTPVDRALIPTGRILGLDQTPFDFRSERRIGDRIDDDDEQLRRGGGYDHNWVLATDASRTLAARLYDPDSGRVMDVVTDQPGLQFYSGNKLDGSVTGKGGRQYGYRSGLCLETQHFPDSPNHPAFPSTVLRPNNPFRSRTIFRFATDRQP
jgi:aldose 1-epimerase